MRVYKTLPKALIALKRDILNRGYCFALSVEIPPDRDMQSVLYRLKDTYVKYPDAYQRSRARKRGEAVFRVIVVPSQRLVWIAATPGYHDCFFKNPHVRDVRRSWVSFGAYALRRSRNVTRIKVVDDVYNSARSVIVRKALFSDVGDLEGVLADLKWFSSSDTERQKRMILSHINHQRKIHHLSSVSLS